MKHNLVYDTYKYIGNVKDFKLESRVCFADVNSALEYLKKYLNGQGLVRPKHYTGKKVYSSIEEYEKEIEEQSIEMSE